MNWLSASQSLQSLGKWGRYFKVFANYTQIEVRGQREADFSGFLPKALNYGITYSKSPFIVMAKWHQRSDVTSGPAPVQGPDGQIFIKGRTQLDLNISYQVRKNMSLFLNGRNVTNERVDFLRYGSLTPSYANMYQARNYGGATLDMGIKGSF